MEEKMINLIKDKPLVIPRLLISNYHKLGITDEELVVLILLMSYDDNIDYNPDKFAKEIDNTKHNVMKIINSLCDKNIVSLVIEKNNRKTYEYLSLNSLYEKLFNLALDKKEEKEIDDSVFSIFENELGRTLSPMEYEKIKEWITSGNSNELIILALKEAVLNGVGNLNYIDKILTTWKKKGYKTKEDIAKDKEMYQEKKEKNDIFYTDWLNE